MRTRISRYSGSPTHLVVMHVRSSARDRSSRIDYWTLNSRNVNSTFAASGRFSHSRSHLFTINKLMPERVCTCACACVCACRGVCVCMRVVCVWWVSEWVGGRGEGNGNGRIRKKNHGTTQETSFERERQGWEKGRQGGYFLISGETTRDKGRLPETSRDHWLSTSYRLLTWDY